MTKYYKVCLSAVMFILALALTLSPVQAEESRHHEAHEHGIAHMNVAVEGNRLYIEFTSPAANIVGFEHHPRTAEQKAAVKKAMEMLKAETMLFALPPGAEGQLVKSSVNTDIISGSEHGSEEGHIHKQEQERHSEFKAEYRFDCKKPQKLGHIEVKLFHLFPGIEHIEVQLLTPTKQTALEMTAKKNKIVF